MSFAYNISAFTLLSAFTMSPVAAAKGQWSLANLWKMVNSNLLIETGGRL